MTSLFQVLAADDSEHRLAAHKAVILSKTRVENEYGKFIAKHGESALDYLETEIAASVHIACAEVGHKDPQGALEIVLTSYRVKPEPRTASVHEARKPKMCPFHKDVVDISLAQGDPKAGFESLRDHWGGDRHCEGGGYEGDKCKFKPQMTTQTFWDEKTEKAERKRQERNEQAEQATGEERSEENDQPVEEAEVLTEAEPTTEAVEEPVADATEPADDNVVHVDFGATDVEAPAEGTGVPMSMVASFKTSDSDPQHHAEGVIPGHLGIHTGTVKWLNFLDAKINGKSCRSNGEAIFTEHGMSRSPNFRSPVTVSVHHPEHLPGAIEAIETSAQGAVAPPKLKEAAQRMAAGELPCPPGVARHEIKFSSVKTADGDGNTGLGGPSPKIDKRKWTPQTVPALKGVDDEDGPHPTRRKDIIEPIIPEDFEELSEVGEQVTEHQDVTKDTKDIIGDPTKTWSGGGHSAVSSHDPHKNELVEIMKNDFDGLLPQHEIDRAVVAHRNR